VACLVPLDEAETLTPPGQQVADAFEAMTADRSYRPAIGHEAAQAELERCSGTQFDERVVTAFLRAVRRELRLGGRAADVRHSGADAATVAKAAKRGSAAAT
jgi:hypothetical protein